MCSVHRQRIHHKVIICNLATNIIENDTSAPQYFTGLVTAQEGQIYSNTQTEPFSSSFSSTSSPKMLTSLNYGLVIGFFSFVGINRLTALLHRTKIIYPANVLAADNEYYYWRYRNFFVSFCHATITGLGSLYCVIQKPILLIDVIDTYTEFGYVLTSFSFGYFLYDTLEMFTHTDYKGTLELIFHHVLILLCFSNTIYFHKYCGYNMIALLIETSNIFLHFRQILLLSNYPKSGPYYQVNCVINIVLFVLIRGSCMFWLWYTLLINLQLIHMVTKVIAITAMVGISITTVILFKRVFNSDFIIDGWAVSRRRVAISGGNAKGSGDHEGKYSNCSSNPSGAEADLYEPMADSLSSANGGDSGTGSQSTGAGSTAKESSSYSLRKRLNGAEAVAATTAAAVNN